MESELFTGDMPEQQSFTGTMTRETIVPSSHQRSELSNTIPGTFSRGDKKVWKCIPVPNGLGVGGGGSGVGSYTYKNRH